MGFNSGFKGLRRLNFVNWMLPNWYLEIS